MVRRQPKSYRGSALLLAAVAMIILALLALAALTVGRDGRIAAFLSYSATAARYAADAGVARTLYVMNRILADKAWPPQTLPSFSDQALAGSEAVYSAFVSGSLASGYQITSTGQCRNATRTVRATVALANPFSLNFAVLTRNTIKLDGNSVISGYNSGDPSSVNLPISIGTLSVTPGAIDIKNGATVNGDVYVGLNGNPATGVTTKFRTDIKGELLTQPPPMPTLDMVSVPSLSNKGKIKGNNITLTSADSGTYSSMDIDNGGILQVQDNCVLVVRGDIRLRNGARINIASNGSLVIYLYGNLIGDTASGVYNDSRIPAKFKLYGVGPAGQQIDLKNSSDFYGAVYAPNADATIFNGGDIYGAIIVNNFEMKNSGNVMYDNALRSVSVSDPAAMFIITRWEEL